MNNENVSPKRNFNLIFNSSDTSSITGNIYDALYSTSFTTLVDENKYLKSKYKLSFRMKSATSVNILSTETYKVEIHINSIIFNQSNLSKDYTLGVLSKCIEDYTNNLLSIDTKPNDNPPVIIQSLERLCNINIKIVNSQTGALYTNMPPYIIILNFEEI